MGREWVDFKAVKQTVSMEMAVARYGVMLRRVDRTYLRGRCPPPTHRSKSSNQTFIVNTDKNAWRAILILEPEHVVGASAVTCWTLLRQWKTARFAMRR